ncbi:MAG: PA0069 family radical SAM protein [Opitutales bacterium]
MQGRASMRGRGAATNPPNRFETHVFAPEEAEEARAAEVGRATTVLTDHAQSILSKNNSPDIAFTYSVNPYRGCEHGCAYCYARPTHEYLGYSAGLDFETRILAKREAPRLLREALARDSWEPQVVAMSGVTDPYQPIERDLGITRGCIEVLAEFRNPVGLITKNAGILRDLDLLASMAEWNGVQVTLSITTLEPDLARVMEPRTASPRQRLEVVRILASAGIPVSVLQGPLIPGLTDTELPAIIEAAAEAGARSVGYTLLRLPGAVEGIFTDWLQRAVPTKQARVLDRLRQLRGGRLNSTAFGERMRGQGPWREHLAQLHRLGLRRAGLRPTSEELNVNDFRRPGGHQLELFAGE